MDHRRRRLIDRLVGAEIIDESARSAPQSGSLVDWLIAEADADPDFPPPEAWPPAVRAYRSLFGGRVAPFLLLLESFNPAYYRGCCGPLLGHACLLDHYLDQGWRLGLSPTPKFDPEGYAVIHAGRVPGGMNPFLHFLTEGWKAGLSPNPLRRGFRDPLRPPAALEVAVDVPILQIAHGARDLPAPAGQRICVHVHMFYAEMAKEMLGLLQRIVQPFDLFVSVRQGARPDTWSRFFSDGLPLVARVLVREVPNRGRDVASWLVAFGPEIRSYGLFCHIHTKRSLSDPKNRNWFAFLAHALFGSRATVAQILARFDRDPRLGLVCPGYWLALKGQPNFGEVQELLRALLHRMDLTQTVPFCPDYPAGSFFWCRPEILDPLLRLGLTWEDFEPEAGQRCGTLAHALERVLGVLPAAAGMTLRFVEPDIPFNLAARLPVLVEAPVRPAAQARRISVILPDRGGRAQDVLRRLACVLGQDTAPDEVILLDTAEQPGLPGLLARGFAAAFGSGQVRLLTLPSCSLAGALNIALAEASGDVICYLCAGGTWGSDVLSVVAEGFAAHPAAEAALLGLAEDPVIAALPGALSGTILGGGVGLSHLAHARLWQGTPPRFDPDEGPSGIAAFILRAVGRRPPLLLAARAQEALPTDGGAARLHLRADLLRQGAEPWRIAIKCPAPDRERAYRWGDFHFANSLCRALRELGCQARVDVLNEWYLPGTEADDAVILLRGVHRYKVRRGQVNLMWMLSHPDRVTAEEMRRYDHVFVASLPHALALQKQLKGRISALLQCSDPAVFAAAPAGPAAPRAAVLFVGNSRKTDRWIAAAAVASGHPVAVYGAEWEGRTLEPMVVAENIDNDQLARHYRAADIVLNDHWPEMAQAGFVSNRLFDVALAGGFPLSDSFTGSEMFFGALAVVRDEDELDQALRYWRDNPGQRMLRSRCLRQTVAARHTFLHRAREILREIGLRAVI